MMSGGSGSKIQMMQMQPDALVNMSGGTPPVSGTKYEWSTDGSVANAIGTQKNVKIIGIQIRCTWTVQPTPLEVHVTIDGNVITHTFSNPVSGTHYFATLAIGSAETNQGLDTSGNVAAYLQPLYEGKSVKVEAEITGGTVSALDMRVKWAKVV